MPESGIDYMNHVFQPSLSLFSLLFGWHQVKAIGMISAVLFFMLYGLYIQTFESLDEILSMLLSIQLKVTEDYFPVIVFVMPCSKMKAQY